MDQQLLDEARERILANPIYQHVSDALAGSVEYSAMEKVYELVEGGGFDLIVVDTPPAQHALDFLEAPQRLLEFLDSRLVHMLIHPAFAAGRSIPVSTWSTTATADVSSITATTSNTTNDER